MIYVDKSMLVDTIYYFEFLERDRLYQEDIPDDPIGDDPIGDDSTDIEDIRNKLYQEDIFDDPIEIQNVRVELSHAFSRSRDEDRDTPSATIFVYGKHTTPLPNFKERSKVNIHGIDKDFYIKKVIVYSEPVKSAFSQNSIFSVELELV